MIWPLDKGGAERLLSGRQRRERMAAVRAKVKINTSALREIANPARRPQGSKRISTRCAPAGIATPRNAALTRKTGDSAPSTQARQPGYQESVTTRMAGMPVVTSKCRISGRSPVFTTGTISSGPFKWGATPCTTVTRCPSKPAPRRRSNSRSPVAYCVR